VKKVQSDLQLVSPLEQGRPERAALTASAAIRISAPTCLTGGAAANHARSSALARSTGRARFIARRCDRPASDFDFILRGTPSSFRVFAAQQPASLNDYGFIGLQVARLIPDRAACQIGIGSIGDAITHSLLAAPAAKILLFQQLARRWTGLGRRQKIHLHRALREGVYGRNRNAVGIFSGVGSGGGIMKREV